MAKSGAMKNYKFGPKNNWRRTIWNEVLRRTAGREKTDPILYLAGPQDMDRQVGIEKGVPSQNLIAIDINPENVGRIREGKVPAVCGDAIDVLSSWPENRPVAAVLLDFCSGLTYNTLGVYDMLQRKPLRKAVVAVNFMRGRDSWSNGARAMLSDAGLLIPLWKRGVDGEIECLIDDTKHRAYQFLAYHAFDLVMALGGYGSASGKIAGNDQAQFCYPAPDENGQPDRQLNAMFSMFITGMRPKFFSYNSGALRFDSAVFEHTSRMLPDDFAEPTLDAFLGDYDPATARRVAATLAVRTGRLAARA